MFLSVLPPTDYLPQINKLREKKGREGEREIIYYVKRLFKTVNIRIEFLALEILSRAGENAQWEKCLLYAHEGLSLDP